MYPPITYLTDCSDANAQARLATRLGALFGASPVLLPLDGPAPTETAALTLLDVLSATDRLGEAGHPTVTLVNVAPRDGRWENGAPFCWFRHGPHTVFSTYDPQLFAHVRTHLGVSSVELTDARTVLLAAAQWSTITDTDADDIADSQFRSLWYLPLLAKWVLDEQPVSATTVPITAVPAPAGAAARVAVVDNFGNCKLTGTAEALAVFPGTRVELSFTRVGVDLGSHKILCFRRLIDVPAGEAGLIVGSSGPGFVELVVRGGSAAQRFGLAAGVEVVLH